MSGEYRKILLIEPDARVVEILVDAIVRRFGAQVTCVSHGRDALDIEMLEPQDVVVAACETPDAGGLDLARHLTAASRRPVLMTAESLDADTALEFLRLGVRDVLIKPFPIEDLLTSLDRALESHQIGRAHQVRHRQLRDLTRRLVRDRRELSRRMDLICQDLVGAHRRLVHRVLQFEERIAPG